MNISLELWHPQIASLSEKCESCLLLTQGHTYTTVPVNKWVIIGI